MQKVTAIFDIGKTNKKFFLFDENFKEVFREYRKFETIKDEDGYETDQLQAIQIWAKALFDRIMKTEKYDVKAINFSTYGATLVHLDLYGKPLTPLYNYTKPIEKSIYQDLFEIYGGEDELSVQTASPSSGMLSSGLQLYWLKKTQPAIFEQVKYSLHLPQYMSYIFTGIPVSEYTSLGCHTMMWDFESGDYHDWVYEEGIAAKLGPLVDTDVSINMNYDDRKIRVGVGIHDSSAALIPYLKGSKKPFTLISTGTWSIALNPYSKHHLSVSELKSDCLNYMTIDGSMVRASRLFLGQEYQIQNQKLSNHFDKPADFHKDVKFNAEVYEQQKLNNENSFSFDVIETERDQPENTDLNQFDTFEAAYHRLMIELVDTQVQHLKYIEGDTDQRIFVDGGFVDNELFVEVLGQRFPRRKILTSKSALGSSLGAAMVISDQEIGKKFLKKKYGVKKHKPLILSNFEDG
ncbi:FGGY-family carbohydrate kinase [Portibacter marinus]|uniref:FGGY-family carbohydrate kinase n=1 Tax=Portibacter marinus TaxID=2898660 RepID=UPI001EFF3E35|nr:FGGY family carbohydrate kinase [Portibacter marinus]